MQNSRELSSGKSSGLFRTRLELPEVTAPRSGAGVSVVVCESQVMHEDELSQLPEWQLARRVATSKRLSRSEFLPKFLLYVCEQKLTGNTQEITEQRIGNKIFNRNADYDPGEDNIVRSYARLLRRRLEEYFQGEGRDELMQIVIPRGGYAPSFLAEPDTRKFKEDVEPIVNDGEALIPYKPPVATLEDTRLFSASMPRSWWYSVVVGPLLGGLLTSALWFAVHSILSERALGPLHVIWAQLFQHNRNTLIVPADSGLGIVQNLTGHLVTLEEYVNGSYLTDKSSVSGLGIDNLNDLRRQRYTSVVDLNVTSMLTQLPEYDANRSQVRFARNITAEDFKNSNVILIGSPHSNPWVSLFNKRLNFQLEYTPKVDQSFVLNQHPAKSEQKMYFNATDETNRTYGTIDYLPSLDGVGHVLIIQGLNMAATQAAADTLFNAEAMKPVLQQATLAKGTLKPFELLVETISIGANAPAAQIVAARFYPE